MMLKGLDRSGSLSCSATGRYISCTDIFLLLLPNILQPISLKNPVTPAQENSMQKGVERRERRANH
jgi:hypothetical protein